MQRWSKRLASFILEIKVQKQLRRDVGIGKARSVVSSEQSVL